MEDDDDFEDLPEAASRSLHLLARYRLERVAVRGNPRDANVAMARGMLLDTCHGCGDDLPRRGQPPNLLCPRCLEEAVWLWN